MHYGKQSTSMKSGAIRETVYKHGKQYLGAVKENYSVSYLKEIRGDKISKKNRKDNGK